VISIHTPHETQLLKLQSPWMVKEDVLTPDWSPFLVLPRQERAKKPRPIQTLGGLCDRVRTAAFAELQAYHAFNWASDRFLLEAPHGLPDLWLSLAQEELGHLSSLLSLLEKLGEKPSDHAVSDWLFVSFMKCQSAREFAVFMASAEERGQKAGLRFESDFSKSHQEASELFGKIARDEQRHIDSAYTYFPVLPKPA